MNVERGERIVILGPSGSGKSSLLNVLSGVIPFSQNLELEGTLRLGGVDASETPVVHRSRAIGMVAQDPTAAICLARVDHEVALPLENHGVPRHEIGARIDEALRTADAAGLRDRATSELSGGETQRVALAATMAPRPTVLLLDEPTSMLDPAGVDAVRGAIRSVIDEQDPAVVLVEHRLDEYAGTAGIAGLPERAIVLSSDGSVFADGPTDVVLRENAALLHSSGCWLPLDAELLALSGHDNGLDSEKVRSWLRELASAPPLPTPGGPEQPVLLGAESLEVGHGGPERRSRRARTPVAPSVLHEVTLDVHAGEVVALLGANGSGKSSLLLTLAGLLPPVSGRITGARPSMVFQNPEYQFLAHRVRDEIAVGLGSDAPEVVDRQLRIHRLDHVADRNPHRLSGGEKRRLSLAAMLAHDDRRVILADEPTFGLDRRDTAATSRALRREAEDGRGVVFSSHDLRLVATIADRVIVLAHGRVIADGPTTDVLRDAEVLAEAGLKLPALLSWLLTDVGGEAAVQALRHIDEAEAVASVSLITAGPGEEPG